MIKLLWCWITNTPCSAQSKDGSVCLKTYRNHSDYHVSEKRIWGGKFTAAQRK